MKIFLTISLILSCSFFALAQEKPTQNTTDKSVQKNEKQLVEGAGKNIQKQQHKKVPKVNSNKARIQKTQQQRKKVKNAQAQQKKALQIQQQRRQVQRRNNHK